MRFLIFVFFVFCLSLGLNLIGIVPSASLLKKPLEHSGLVKKTILSGGLKREYWIDVPPRCSNNNTHHPVDLCSLVMVLHGAGGQAKNLPNRTMPSWKRLARQDHVILVYPQGVNRHWNDSHRSNNRRFSALLTSSAPNDVSFLSALIDKMIKTYPVDETRVSVVGISNGAMMVNRLACEIPNRLASVAMVMGSMPKPLRASCQPNSKLSVMIINGTADPIMPYKGGAITLGKRNRGSVISTEATLNFWAQNIGFNPQKSAFQVNPLRDSNPHDGTRVIQKQFQSDDGYEVVLYSILGGGHTWPGSHQHLPLRLVGTTGRDIDASQEIWDFFKDHSSIIP